MTDNKYLEEMLESLERRLVGVINHNSARQRDYETKLDRLCCNVNIACSSIEKRIEKLEKNSPIPVNLTDIYQRLEEVIEACKELTKRSDSSEGMQRYLLSLIEANEEKLNKIRRRVNRNTESRTSPIRGYDEGDYKISVRVLKRLADLEKRIVDIEDDYWEEE